MVGKVTPDTMMSASRLPGLFGVSKYSSPNKELAISMAALDGAEREDITNEAMQWGNRLERMILEESANRLGLLSSLDTDWPDAQYHESWQLCCSLDGRVIGDGRTMRSDEECGIYVIGADEITLDGPGILEAKLTRVWPEKSPAIYRGPLQLQGQMAITGASWGAVCVLYQGVELRIFLFNQDLNVQAVIEEKVAEFAHKLSRYHATGEVDHYEVEEAQ